MKLSTKFWFYFISLIIVQATLTTFIIGYFLKQQNVEDSLKEVREEAKIVFDNYNSWKIYLWKNLAQLKNNPELQKLISSNERQSVEKLYQSFFEKASKRSQFSRLDYFALQFNDHLTVFNIQNSKQYDDLAVNISHLLHAEKTHPYLTTKFVDGKLVMLGVFALQATSKNKIEIYFIKVLDDSFLKHLAVNRKSRNLISLNNRLITDDPSQPTDSSYLKNIKSETLYSELIAVEIQDVIFNGVIQKIGYINMTGQENSIYLTSLISNQKYASKLNLIYRVISLIVIGGLVFSIFLSLYISKHITRPIGNLLAVMKNTKNGQFDATVHQKASFEVSRLINGFNVMLQNLGKQKKKLDEYILEIEGLRDYNERIIDSIGAGILSVNQDFIIEKTNRVFLNKFNLMEIHVQNRDIRQASFSFVDDHFLNEMKRIFENQTNFITITKRVDAKSIYLIRFYAFYTSREPNNARKGCLVSIKNIYEQITFEEKMLQMEKLSSLSILSAGVAHEINNPLSSILANVQNLIVAQKNGKDIDSLKWIEKETFRIGEIVNRLLDFATPNPKTGQRTNVNEIINQVLEIIKYALKQGITLNLNLSKNTIEASISEDELKQVMVNLITNAIHACNDTGEINICTQIDDEKNNIAIEISDKGVGIPSDVLPHIFDPFYTTKQLENGTGLGLSVVYGIINKHHGKIQVESSINEGSLFKISIPGFQEKHQKI